MWSGDNCGDRVEREREREGVKSEESVERAVYKRFRSGKRAIWGEAHRVLPHQTSAGAYQQEKETIMMIRRDTLVQQEHQLRFSLNIMNSLCSNIFNKREASGKEREGVCSLSLLTMIKRENA